MGLGYAIAERGYVPDFLVRREIRRLVRDRLHDERRDTPAARAERFAALIEALGQQPRGAAYRRRERTALRSADGVFRRRCSAAISNTARVSGTTTPKISTSRRRTCCGSMPRGQICATANAFSISVAAGDRSRCGRRADIPAAQLTAVSNSRTQRAFIEQQAKRYGLTNLSVVTADANALDFPPQSFDRVVSVEMFEHVRNYRALLERISRWLAADGKLFVHIFCHRELMYPFETDGDDDWMGRHFFTGGLMPSVKYAGLLPAAPAHRRTLGAVGQPLPAHGRRLARANGRKAARGQSGTGTSVRRRCRPVGATLAILLHGLRRDVRLR